MPPTFHELEANGLRFHYVRWAPERGARPPCILSHATGFCGMVWRRVAEALAVRYDVYALDRRGHGRSSKPDPDEPAAYAFDRFSEDMIAVLDALELRDAVGVGHSGGATDLLFAAAERPDLFSAVVAVEPILIAPQAAAATPAAGAQAGGEGPPDNMAEIARKRRTVFDSRAALIERYGSRPPFDSWEADVLDDYVDYGFDQRPDGSVELLCPPAVEAAMFGGAALLTVDPTPRLRRMACPLLVISGGESGPSYESMAGLAQETVPGARRLSFAGASHFVPMELPDRLSATVLEFAGPPA